MTCNSCINRCCRTLCTLLIISILAGIVIGALAFFGILPAIAAVLPFAIAVVALVLLLLTIIIVSLLFRRDQSDCGCVRTCICCFARWIVIAAAIALFTTLGLLVLGGVAIGSIFNAVLVGIGAAAFIFMLLAFFALLLCLIRCGCNDNDVAAA